MHLNFRLHALNWFVLSQDILLCSIGEDTVAMMVNADHPDVVKAVECANVTINSSSISVTQEMYMEALRSGIDLAEQKKREKDPNGPRFVV